MVLNCIYSVSNYIHMVLYTLSIHSGAVEGIHNGGTNCVQCMYVHKSVMSLQTGKKYHNLNPPSQ